MRHPSFRDPAFVALLRRHRIALCVADTAGIFPDFEDVTADFVYVRLHGDAKIYESGYARRTLRAWAARATAWHRGEEPEAARLADSDHRAEPRPEGRDVYVYFDNDAKVHAPFDARALRAWIAGAPVPSSSKALAGAGEPARTHWPPLRTERVKPRKELAAARSTSPTK